MIALKLAKNCCRFALERDFLASKLSMQFMIVNALYPTSLDLRSQAKRILPVIKLGIPPNQVKRYVSLYFVKLNTSRVSLSIRETSDLE
jgi:hypothetical protein